MRSQRKVSIIGAGYVGATTAYTLALKNLVDEIVLIDINEKKAFAEALDISHGSLFFEKVLVYGSSDYEACKDSDIVIVSVGGAPLALDKKMTRTDLGRETYKIIKSFLPDLAKITPNSIFLFITNPVDVITMIARNLVDTDPKKIIGSGTVLDSARLRYLISERCNIAQKNIHAHILGEHGESSFPLWSSARIGPTFIDKWKAPDGKLLFDEVTKKEIAETVIYAGYSVVEGKGVTNYAIALSTIRILESIFASTPSILTVSSPMTCYPEFSDVSLSLPSIVGRDGVIKTLNPNCSKQEEEKLLASAKKIKNDYETLIAQYD